MTIFSTNKILFVFVITIRVTLLGQVPAYDFPSFDDLLPDALNRVALYLRPGFLRA